MGALDKYERQVVSDLGLVCKGWRDATLYTHRLWCAITISSTDRLSGHQKATKWLERSRSMPKTIEYHSLWNRCECSGRQMCHSTNPLLIKLLSEGPLLHHFELQVARRECFKNWIAAMGATKKTHSFPRPWDSLRSFELTFDNEEHDRWDQLEEPAQSIFNILPPVTSLSIHLPPADNAFPNLSGTETDSRYGVLDIPRDLLIGLTTLTLSCDWKGTRLLAILQHCTNVETLSLDFNLQRFPFMHEHDYPFSKALANCPILLPKTHTLRLSQAGTAEVLKYLQAPALTHLHLEFSGSEIQITDFENTIPRFLRVSRATGSLLTLHISNASISGAHLRRSLSGLRSLKLLSLDHIELRDTLFIRSAPGDAIHPHLPSVEHFKLLELNSDYKSIGVACLDERRGCTPCIMTVSFQKKHSDYEYIQHYASLFLWKENASITLLTIPPI
ncbi:hypothetical protein DFP72DRAFT_639449 [Ephemerocybe angulata]|uniref:F-box domain-containing protein n=1 Tax=Ephemerocybe angulata TaxID=980116 RepID=A0A8H6HHK4_9AGAR|nr:hypothetical protein DFP72DRAFT_639449 [Tulosesus angulatus]